MFSVTIQGHASQKTDQEQRSDFLGAMAMSSSLFEGVSRWATLQSWLIPTRENTAEAWNKAEVFSALIPSTDPRSIEGSVTLLSCCPFATLGHPGLRVWVLQRFPRAKKGLHICVRGITVNTNTKPNPKHGQADFKLCQAV